jgi:hypothetical protein
VLLGRAIPAGAGAAELSALLGRALEVTAQDNPGVASRGPAVGAGAGAPPRYFRAASYRFATSGQFTTFHHAAT